MMKKLEKLHKGLISCGILMLFILAEWTFFGVAAVHNFMSNKNYIINNMYLNKNKYEVLEAILQKAENISPQLKQNNLSYDQININSFNLDLINNKDKSIVYEIKKYTMIPDRNSISFEMIKKIGIMISKTYKYNMWDGFVIKE